MTLSETKLINKLIESYSAVDQFVFHMMDTDNFFHGRPKFSAADARSRMSEILRLYPEKLIGFIAYDPNKGVKELKPFLENGLFKGIKFYPPMGYNAISNNNSAWNDNNRELFRYCCEKKIPVFAHCTPTGFEAIPEKTGRNSDPHFWNELLNQDEFENLYLCLGHAGGVEGWFEPFEEVSIFGRPTDGGKFFSEKVYELCTNFPNVYCEFGFLDHIHDPDQYNNFKQRLEFLFKKDETEAVKYRFRDKIMYGSDWHILFNHGIQLNYEKPYLNLFKEGIIGDYSEEFFNGNALKYLRPKNRSY